MSTTVINHRKIAVDIIWWEKAGFKVPNQAIYSETINNNEINYVIKNKSGIESKSYVITPQILSIIAPVILKPPNIFTLPFLFVKIPSDFFNLHIVSNFFILLSIVYLSVTKI